MFGIQMPTHDPVVLSDYVRVYGWDAGLPSFRGGGTVGPMPAGDPSFFWMGPGSNYTIPSSPYFNDAQGTDPNFEAPASWRMNLALDLVTAKGYELTLEYNHDDVDQAVFYQDAGLTPTGYLADGRGTYSGHGDYIMTNTDKGGAEALSFTVRKSFDQGVSVFGAYSHVTAKDVYPLTSSQAESSYGYTQRWDGENLDAAPSSFMAKNKLILGLEYRTSCGETTKPEFLQSTSGKTANHTALLLTNPDTTVSPAIQNSTPIIPWLMFQADLMIIK